MTSQFVIEVQPLFIRNSFYQFFACVPSYQAKSLLLKPKCVWKSTSADERIADSSWTSGHVRKVPEAVAISSAPITHSSGQDWCVGCGLYLRSLGALMSKSIQKKMRMLHYSDHDERVTAQI